MDRQKAPRATTKEKATKKRGMAIFKQRQVRKIKHDKQERAARKQQVEERPKKTPVLLRSEEGAGAKPRRDSAFTDRMNVDDFMESGFMQAMEEEEEDGEEEDEEESDDDDAPSAKMGKGAKHKNELLELSKSDPAFFEYMKKTDPNLLKFTPDADEEDEEDDEDEEDEEDEGMDDEEAAAAAEAFGGAVEEDDDSEEEDSEDEQPAARAKKAKVAKVAAPLIEVTAEMMRAWQKQLLSSKENSALLKEVITAFRAAVRFGDADGADDDVYTFSSGHVFNLLMQFCLQHMDELIRRHVAGGAGGVAAGRKTKGGVERPDQWTHWRKHQPMVKTYLTYLLLFVGQLGEASMIAVAVQQCHRLMPFYLVLPKLAPKLLKSTLKVWSADERSGGSQQITLLGCAPTPALDRSLRRPPPCHHLKPCGSHSMSQVCHRAPARCGLAVSLC